jgi:colicin import membrane protein
VDLIDLPDKQDLSVPEPEVAAADSKPPTTSPPVKEPEPEKAVVLKPNKKPEPEKPKKPEKNKELDAFKKLEQLNAIEKLKTGKSTFKGNVISPGTQLTGVVRLQAESYYADVDRHIRAQWFLPQYLRNKGLSAVVIVKFRFNGQVASIEIKERSGNSTFDDLVLATINRATPVPMPPENLKLKVLHDGFKLRFSE